MGSQCHGWAPGTAIPPRMCWCWKKCPCLYSLQTKLCVYVHTKDQMSWIYVTTVAERLKECMYRFLNTPCGINLSL